MPAMLGNDNVPSFTHDDVRFHFSFELSTLKEQKNTPTEILTVHNGFLGLKGVGRLITRQQVASDDAGNVRLRKSRLDFIAITGWFPRVS